jgi:hypothetical protein
MEIKVTGLTQMNVEALNRLHYDGYATSNDFRTTATTATFTLADVSDAAAWLARRKLDLAKEYGLKGHPTASLNAVIRKLQKAQADRPVEAPRMGARQG